jgi:glycosyltransferase involved in cell wall biosynthesis
MIQKSKFLVQPSLGYETFGLTILEAFSFAIPVIGLKIGTRCEFLIHNYNGYISTKEDFKNIILDSLNIDNYNKLTDGALETFKKYNPDIILDKQITLYENCIKK